LRSKSSQVISRMMIAKQDTPARARLLVSGGLARAPVGDPRAKLRPSEDVGAGVGGIPQRKQDIVIARRLPYDPRAPRSWPHHRQAQAGVAQPQQHLPGAAQLGELAKEQAHRLHDPLVGIERHLPRLLPAVARREAHAQLPPARFGIASGQAPLPEETQLVLGHRALQAEQQPVVHQARIVDAIMIDEEGAHQGAQVDQVMPVATIASEARGFEAEHGAYDPAAHGGHQPLEARPLYQPRSRAAQIFVDRLDAREAQGARRVCERILATLALQVIADLHGGGLPNVHDGAAPEVLRTDFRIQDAPPGRRRRPGVPAKGRPER
jgi:hypothetical protein